MGPIILGPKAGHYSVTLTSQTGEHYANQHLHQPVLSGPAVNGGKDSLRRRTSNVDCASSIPTKSCWKNLAATIRAPAGLAVSSRTAAFGGGLYDGSARNYFFQRIEGTGERKLPLCFPSIIRGLDLLRRAWMAEAEVQTSSSPTILRELNSLGCTG